MVNWQVDLYRRPLQDEVGNPLWELVVCDTTGALRHTVLSAQSDVSSNWVVKQLEQLVAAGCPRPDRIQVFRPQTLNLLEPACKVLGIAIEPTRHVPQLKQHLKQLAQLYPTQPGYSEQPYNPLELDQPPPLPLDEGLWGQQWQFAALPAAEVAEAFSGRMIPIVSMPETLLPLNLGLASTIPVPGVVIEGGRRSRQLAQWIQAANPVELNYIAGAPDGLILEAGLVDRWIVATFADSEVAQAAVEFEQRKRISQGLHFLLVQPDSSGVTYSGVWLLKAEL